MPYATPLVTLDVMAGVNENTALRVAALGFAGAVGFASAVAVREQLPMEALGRDFRSRFPQGWSSDGEQASPLLGQCLWQPW